MKCELLVVNGEWLVASDELMLSDERMEVMNGE
jgi:hypothetical protein